MHLLCMWLEKVGGSQPLSTASCQRERSHSPEVGQIEWGVCSQAFGTFPGLAHPLLHQLGVHICPSAQLGRKGEKLLRGGSSQAWHQLFLAGH